MEKVSLEGPLKQQQNVLAVGETNRQTDLHTGETFQFEFYL